MGWRVVEISSRSKLELKMNYLVIRNETTKRIHLDEISVLIIDNTGCALTASLLEALWKNKINVVFCDSKHNPGAQLLPLNCKYESNAELYSQLNWKQETKAIVWKEIVKDKITKQANNIKESAPDSYSKLIEYSNNILPGDTTNREGQAAKVYFNHLFFHDFSRAEECIENAALNYGYSIILSSINRLIVANGYSTQLGIFHKNTFNQFNLGCDLMEPFRPLVDLFVVKHIENEIFDTEAKMKLVNILNFEVFIDGYKTTVLNAMQVYVKSILKALDENDISLIKMFSYEF